MAAANTDLLKKLARRWVGQIGVGGVSDASVTTIPLSSTTNLPTDTAVALTIDRVDVNGVATPSLEETFIGVVSGSNLVNCVRGSEGTAQAHAAGAVVELLVTAKGYNDIVDAFLTGHTQLGAHTYTAASLTAASLVSASLTSPILTTPQIQDRSSTDQYIFAACELTADRTVMLPVLSADDEFVFKNATQTLTGKTITGSQIVDSTVVSRKLKPNYAHTDLAGNYTSSATSAEQIITGLNTVVTDPGVNMVIFAMTTLDLANVPAGTTNVRLKLNGTQICEVLYANAQNFEHPVTLIGIGTANTGADASITVTLQNSGASAISVYGTNNRATVTAIAWSQ